MSIFQVYSHVSWEEKEWNAESDTSVWLVLKDSVTVGTFFIESTSLG